MNTAVSKMDNVTQQNAAMVEEASAAARSLADEADDLNQQIARSHLTVWTMPPGFARTSPSESAASAGRRVAKATLRIAGSTALAEDWSD